LLCFQDLPTTSSFHVTSLHRHGFCPRNIGEPLSTRYTVSHDGIAVGPDLHWVSGPTLAVCKGSGESRPNISIHPHGRPILAANFHSDAGQTSYDHPAGTDQGACR